ncbi:MAG TPA: fumarylacetoacetase [Actinomycetales bacterium]|nr:fumarylacetoacetase [Actinomycetales bacterium]
MTLSTWAPVPADSQFGVANLPYGAFSRGDENPRVGVRIGDNVLDLSALAGTGDLPADVAEAVRAESLDTLLAAGPQAWKSLREWVTGLLTDPAKESGASPHLVPLADVRMHMPFTVADYVDFYSSEHHAANVGKMFRPDAPPLLPNWKHLPVGYHGRAGTVVVSGTDIVRPCGQRKAPDESAPTFGASRRLDIEAEVGFVIGGASRLGEPVPTSAFADYVFGVALVNDWSARDIQNWEYVPLGPFLGKSFATSISAWITPLAALEQARVQPPKRTHALLDYLADDPDRPWGLDLTLEIDWNGTVVSRPPFASMYWTPAQQLAHMTVNGATVRPGDLYASGTVSGTEVHERGSFLELSWSGSEPVRLADGSLRTFLEDGDTVTLRASAPGPDGVRIGLGEVTGRIRPARS